MYLQKGGIRQHRGRRKQALVCKEQGWEIAKDWCAKQMTSSQTLKGLHVTGILASIYGQSQAGLHGLLSMTKPCPYNSVDLLLF